MTARLSPAQQRVVDAMRNGAELHRFLPPTWLDADLWDLKGGASPSVSRRTGRRLLRLGVIEVEVNVRSLHIVYHLAPAYQGGEA